MSYKTTNNSDLFDDFDAHLTPINVMERHTELHQDGGGEIENSRAEKLLQAMDISTLNQRIFSYCRKGYRSLLRGNLARNLQSQQIPSFRDQSQGRKESIGKPVHMSR